VGPFLFAEFDTGRLDPKLLGAHDSGLFRVFSLLTSTAGLRDSKETQRKKAAVCAKHPLLNYQSAVAVSQNKTRRLFQ
jgi:hypothetical protein